MTADLVGPLPTVSFRGGPWLGGVSFAERRAAYPKVVYTPPSNTLDPRYEACTDHRVACDCREAEFAEDRDEAKSERDTIQTAANEILAGHAQYVYDEDGRQVGPGCMCTGCQIASRAYIYVHTGWQA